MKLKIRNFIFNYLFSEYDRIVIINSLFESSNNEDKHSNFRYVSKCLAQELS